MIAQEVRRSLRAIEVVVPMYLLLAVSHTSSLSVAGPAASDTSSVGLVRPAKGHSLPQRLS